MKLILDIHEVKFEHQQWFETKSLAFTAPLG